MGLRKGKDLFNLFSRKSVFLHILADDVYAVAKGDVEFVCSQNSYICVVHYKDHLRTSAYVLNGTWFRFNYSIVFNIAYLFADIFAMRKRRKENSPCSV